jgi:hypothetical protein
MIHLRFLALRFRAAAAGRAAARGAVTAMFAAVALQAAPSRAADGDAATGSTGSGSLETVVVTAQRLNEARLEIETQTGASTYTIDSQAIVAEPGGGNQPLNEV